MKSLTDTPKTKILIIEDSPTQIQQLEYTLENNNYYVLTAHNAADALELLKQTQPDIIISDIVMPGMDGYAFCRTVKHDPAINNIPIILLTQLSDPQAIIRGLEAGADNFIIKPYNEEQLVSSINYIMVNYGLRLKTMPETAIDVYFRGQRYSITSSRFQIIDLLFATYETAIQKQKELEQKNKDLQKALETIKTLEGFIPICANCKKIRDDEGFWQEVEVYVENHSAATFTHGICPDCRNLLYPTLKKQD